MAGNVVLTDGQLRALWAVLVLLSTEPTLTQRPDGTWDYEIGGRTGRGFETANGARHLAYQAQIGEARIALYRVLRPYRAMVEGDEAVETNL